MRVGTGTSDLSTALDRKAVTASAPCRVDCGGGWDIKALAILYPWIKPATVNLALNMRAYVTLHPHESGHVEVVSESLQSCDGLAEQLPFSHHLGLVFAIATYFRVHGVRISIRTEFPSMSGLGGSGAVAVAVIAAISEVLSNAGEQPLAQREMVWLAHNIEDGILRGCTGMQDQAAAAFGGVNKWEWHYMDARRPFTQEALLPEGDFKKLEERLVLAYTGHAHQSAVASAALVQSFLDIHSRHLWMEANEITHSFASAVKSKDWRRAAECILLENDIKARMVPEVLSETARDLVESARANQCGARFCGAGAGGCVWGLGETSNIDLLRETWRDILKGIEGARLLPTRISPTGLRIH